MNFYEHTLVAKQDLSNAELDGVHNKYNDIINNTSGKVVKIEKWGLLNFAKKIKNYNKGFFIHYKFEGDATTLNEIKKKTLLDSSILRHLTIKCKKLDLEKEYFNNSEKNIDEKKK
jgi:small subunit ribosomal protein S6|tara:strand:+ start:127 stop:474 length:348 start_codon:yes stop_codon:yes gene_type:complete